ncbi:hypothetical protein [Amycolatopsis magusensis]|uniref:hypothetical protein n=1 Tax=Amycolatopsis magusensis TaxID=882444 RepID=UPI0037AE93F4
MPAESQSADSRAEPPFHLDDGRLRVKITEHGYTDLSRLLFGAIRLTHTSVDDGPRYKRSWDYTGDDALDRAQRAARQWDGQPGTDPAGWNRASDGRRRPDGTDSSETVAP